MGLAEPKSKQTYSDDPNNKAWLNDKSNFGFRLLQKMGWKEGKGLGAKEDGITKHLGVTKKRDNLGVGADHNTAENWLENTTGYSALLERLNQSVGDTKSESNDAHSDKGNDKDTSKKSKKSKKDKSKKRNKSKKSKDKSKKRKREEDDVSTGGKSTSKAKKNRPAIASVTSSRASSDDDSSGVASPAEPTPAAPQPTSVTARPVRLGHRAKFLRSKQMSTLDSSCLNEILGVKTIPPPSSSLGTSAPVPKFKESTTVPMTTSTLNSATYFASKNEKLNKALGKFYPANRFQRSSEAPALGISS